MPTFSEPEALSRIDDMVAWLDDAIAGEEDAIGTDLRHFMLTCRDLVESPHPDGAAVCRLLWSSEFEREEV